MLKDWRERSGKSRADLAQEVGVSDVSIWRIEEGKQTPSLRLAAKLEQITGIPAREFAKASPANSNTQTGEAA